MSLIQRNDEQIQVGTTPGLVAGSYFFVFDGSETFVGSGIFKPDYRLTDPVFSFVSGTGILIKGVEYAWDYTEGNFSLIQPGNVFQDNQWYNVHFQPVPGLLPSAVGIVIDYRFFILDINLPNISLTSATGKILEKLNKTIERYEPECLEGILGYEVYQLLLNETSTRMTELLYGGMYVENGVTKKWRGLVYGEYFSLIADYVYYCFQRFSTTHTTGVSIAVMKTEAGETISPSEKMVRAWNLFSKESRECLCFLWNKKIDDVRVYPEFTEGQYCASTKFSRPTNIFGF